MKNNNSHFQVIFLTGAIILSLELLSSRILTPFFGVSLYIWAGILAITLTSLSIGYNLGGKASVVTGQVGSNKAPALEFMFLLQPALSAIAITVACLIYPRLFFYIARFDLISGAFIASAILLFIPLVSMSAMNPILIALISMKEKDNNGAGHNSGRVLFLSTMGSVGGVFAAAFILIPNMSNFKSMLLLSLLLSLITFIGTFKSVVLTPEKKKQLYAISTVAFTMSLLLLVFSSAYLGKDKAAVFHGQSWQIEEDYPTVFGSIKVATINGSETVYYDGGHRQSHINSLGESMVSYTYAMEGLALGLKPRPKSALVLGLAGGIIPMTLSERGLDVEVVDVIETPLIAATQYFNFDDEAVRVHINDARTFVNPCRNKFDRVIVDLMQGYAVPDHLITTEFYRDIRTCLTPEGSVIINTAVPNRDYFKKYYNILKTIKANFQTVNIYYDDTITDNIPFSVFIVAGDGNLETDMDLKGVPIRFHRNLKATLNAPKRLDAALLENAKVITDEHNFYNFQNAKTYLSYHQGIINAQPPSFLIN